jgi:hypothetical protein
MHQHITRFVTVLCLSLAAVAPAAAQEASVTGTIVDGSKASTPRFRRRHTASPARTA